MTELGTVIKSPSDNRTYKAIKLQNQLQCLIIRDQDALKSCAALSMGVGSFRDPMQAQGLAHYLEHMLFMGTKKYPDENDYSNYITKNAGSNNAYTGQEQTNYMLEISSTAFEGALDRFAQFFIAPLLAQGSAERQLNAVHSEHQKNILNDDWRKYQLSKFISKDKHPFNKFSTGDKDSLANENLQNMLSQFYKVNYSANLMKLVIYGRQQVETIEKWAKQKFSEIPNHNYKRFALEEHPYDHKAFKKLFKIVPIKDLKKLELMWVLRNKKQHYRNPPGNYISNLVGHQGKGSILSYLMKEGLATSLTSGTYDNYNCYTEFTISMDITEKGLTKINEIIGYILFYIQMLKQKGCPKQFFEELKLINKLKFEFMDKKKGMMETAKIAKEMQDRKIEELIIYPYLMEEWKPELIHEYLSELTADNLFVFCTAKQFEPECKLEEPVYKTKYSCQDLKDIKPLACSVDLPEVNIFIPKDLSVLKFEKQKLPTLIYKSEFIDAFFKQDHTFGLPKANINIRLVFDGNFTVVEQIGRALLLDMLKQHLREFVYLAEMASIETQISFVSYIGLDIKFKGFRDSLKLFVVEYLKNLFEFVPSDEQLFKTLIQKHSRRYANYFLNDPYNLAYSKNSATIRTNSSVNEQQKLAEIQKLTLEQVVHLNKQWKRKLFLQSYFAGNITEAETLETVKAVQKFLSEHSKPHKKQFMGQLRPVSLQKSEISIIEQPLKNKSEQNSAISMHLQTGQLTIKTELLLKLLEIIAKQPAFDYLRTQEQLGYVVFCLSEDHRGVGGLSIIIQSSVKSTYELITYVDIFINDKLKTLVQNLTEEQFGVYKNSLKQIKEEKDKNLAAESLRYWSEIVKHKYIFDRKQRQLEILPQITLAEIKQFVKSNIYQNPRRLQIHMVSDKKAVENNEFKNKRRASNNAFQVYESPQSFGRKAQLYPDFYAPNP